MHPHTSAPDHRIVWRQAADDVHVATDAGEYAGFVAATPDGFEAFGALGEDLGLHPARRIALATVATHVEHSQGTTIQPKVLAAPRPRSRPTRPFRARRNGTPGRSHGPRTRRKNTMATGTVKWFNSEKGYGFIAPDDGSADLFAHFSAITGGGFKDLREDQRVEFDAGRGPKGMQAANIRAL
jgi:cold shock CspA family protein